MEVKPCLLTLVDWKLRIVTSSDVELWALSSIRIRDSRDEDRKTHLKEKILFISSEKLSLRGSNSSVSMICNN